MKPVAPAAFAILFAWFAAPARADQVVLKDGQHVEGVAVERSDSVDVALDFGTITFQNSEVQEIVRAPSAIEELDRRHRALAKEDIEGRRQLARWAIARGLQTRARAIYRQIVQLAPSDTPSHLALGDHLVDSRWLTEDEYMTSRGFVHLGGEWKTLAEARTMDLEAAARSRARKDQERIEFLEAQVKTLVQSAEADVSELHGRFGSDERSRYGRTWFGGTGGTPFGGWNPYSGWGPYAGWWPQDPGYVWHPGHARFTPGAPRVRTGLPPFSSPAPRAPSSLPYPASMPRPFGVRIR